MIKAVVDSYAPVGSAALFAVKVSDGENEHSRVVPLTHKSSYQAELSAVKYACELVKNKDTTIILEIVSPFIVRALTKSDDKWPSLTKKKRDATKNVLIGEVREAIDKFDSFEIKLLESHPLRDFIKKHSSI